MLGKLSPDVLIEVTFLDKSGVPITTSSGTPGSEHYANYIDIGEIGSGQTVPFTTSVIGEDAAASWTYQVRVK